MKRFLKILKENTVERYKEGKIDEQKKLLQIILNSFSAQLHKLQSKNQMILSPLQIA